VGPRASLDAVVGEKFPVPVGNRIPDHPALSKIINENPYF